MWGTGGILCRPVVDGDWGGILCRPVVDGDWGRFCVGQGGWGILCRPAGLGDFVYARRVGGICVCQGLDGGDLV